MDEAQVLAESVPEAVGFAEAWWPMAWPVLLALAAGVLFAWAWVARRRRPRVSRAIRWVVALYLLAGALGWAVFLSSESGPEWLGWVVSETGGEVEP